MEAKKLLVVDAVALIVYIVVANPAVTGISAHEWIGIGLFVLFLVHTAQHYDWIVETLRPGKTRIPWQRVGNLALDVLIVVTFAVCTVSGVLISGAVLPALGVYAEGYYFWDPLHAASAKMLLAMLIVHIVAHARMVLRLLKSGKRSAVREVADDGRRVVFEIEDGPAREENHD